MKYFIFLFFLALATSCGSSGPDQYRERGGAMMHALVNNLKKVRTREELMDREEEIKKDLEKLRQLVYETDQYLKSHPEVEIALFSRQNQLLSDELQSELNRLLRMEGCRERLNQLLAP